MGGAGQWHALGREFSCLADEPWSCRAVGGRAPVSRSAVSQHLKILKDAGLVEDMAAGTRRIPGSTRSRWPRCEISSTPTGSGR